MKYIWTVIHGNVRRNKGAYIGIMVLMFVVSLSFVTVYSVSHDSKARKAEAIKEVGYGDYWCVLQTEMMLNLNGTSEEEIIHNIEECETVEKVVYTRAYNFGLKIGDHYTDLVMGLDYQDGKFHFSQYDADNMKISNPELAPWEVSVPKCFEAMYNLHIGDKISIVGSDDTLYELTVVSYFEDPLMGGDVMGIKTVLVSKETQDLLEDIFQNELARDLGRYNIVPTAFISIFKVDHNMKDAAFEKSLNQKASISSFATLSLTVKQSDKYVMMIVNLFSGVAVAFIAILLIASFIVMGHSINSSIEQDYVNLGIYKAIGMSSTAIRMSFAISYSIASVIGLLLGVPIAIPLIKYMNGVLSRSTSLFFDVNIDFALVVLMVVVTIAVVLFFVILRSHKVTKIAPVIALNDGRKSVSFSSLLNTKISKRFLNTSLAYRQVSSNIKRYVSVVLITVLLSIFMVIINNVYAWSKDGKRIGEMFTFYHYDGYISYREAVEEEVNEIITSYSDYQTFDYGQYYFLLDDVQVACCVLSNTDFVDSLIKGRVCEYDNEIMITPYIADEFELGVGDEVKVTLYGTSKMMVVSGIFDYANDMGKAFAMTEDTRNTFRAEDYNEKFVELFGEVEDPVQGFYFKLDDHSKYAEIRDALHEKFGDEFGDDSDIRFLTSYEEDLDNLDLIGSFSVGISAMTFLVYILGALFISITISLVASKTMHSERKDYGIYKSIGLPSSKLRMQMALKFMFVGMIGATIGSVISLFVTDPILSKIFYQFGISRYNSNLTASDVILPVVFMGIMGYICAYVSSRKIKKVDPRILIVE